MASSKATNNEFDWFGFSEIGRKMYLNAGTADVFFMVDDGNGELEAVPAHRSVLAAGSDVFHRMFYVKQEIDKNLRITEAAAPALKEFLRCFYMNKVVLSFGNLHEVMRLSEKYHVEKCNAACIEMLQRSPTADNVCQIYSHAILSNQPQLKAVCEQFIGENIAQVLQSDGFLACDKAILDYIVRRDVLPCSETALFEACMAWVKKASKQQNLTKQLVQTYLRNSFYEIRFRSMMISEFNILRSTYECVFSDDELSEISQMIANEQIQTQFFNGKHRNEQEFQQNQQCYKMLWQKESNNPDALYVDFLALHTHRSQHNDEQLLAKRNKLPAKNNRISQKIRALGNDSFSAGNWCRAMLLYNDSLRFATPGSINISLAYANRSACFLHMKLYEKCLVDIKLAKEAGYPAQLLPKLERRRMDCLKKMEDDPKRDVFEVKLSHDPNEKFPFVANVVTFKRDANGECRVFAKESIDIGQTIGIERPYQGCVLSNFGYICNICMTEKANLMPCDSCSVAMFCSKQCQQSTLHGYECGLTMAYNPGVDGALRNMIRLIFTGVNLFPTVAEFMQFVEDTIQLGKQDIPDALSDAKSVYQGFLQMALKFDSIHTESIYAASFAYRFLLNHPKIKTIFQTERHKRFLMHFTLLIALSPCFEETSPSDVLHSSPQNEGGPKILYSYSVFTRKYFKYSCAPNVARTKLNGCFIYTTVRPVNKGEQLWMGYPALLQKPKDVRQHALQEVLNGECKCSRCQGIDATKEQRKQLAADQIYKKILLKSHLETEYNSNMKRLAEQTEVFLRKYAHVEWCDEIALAVHIYVHVLALKFQ